MKKWRLLAATSLVSLAMASGVAYAEGSTGKSEVKTVGNIRVEFITQGESLSVGENSIAVDLRDTSTGQPIVRESVRVELTMDENDKSMNHGAMSNQKPVVANLKAGQQSPGVYSGTVSLSDAGKWNARVFYDAANATRSASFGLEVRANGANRMVIGGLVAVLVLGALVAVVLRMRQRTHTSSSTATGSPAPEVAQP